MRIATLLNTILSYIFPLITLSGLLVSCIGVSESSIPTPTAPDRTATSTAAPVSTAAKTQDQEPTSIPEKTSSIPGFDGGRALQDIQAQMNLGPRTHGSEPHSEFIKWIEGELTAQDWTVELQKKEILGQEVNNVIAKRVRNDDYPWVILGAHFDTRLYADNDQNIDFQTTPVPGANDGASGVAVLLELARVIPKNINANLWLVFFDAEDNGGIPGYEWILGSTAFVESLEDKPDMVLVVDMVGDKDLNINIEKNSDPILSQEIWQTASSLGYSDQFIDIPKHRIIDDHLPFVQAEIPAVLIIDIEYPYWHQTTDTIDKVSAESLKIVGEVMLNWLAEKYRDFP